MVWRHFYKLVFLFPVPWHKLKALNSSFPGDLPTVPTICLFVPYFFPHPEAQVGVPLLMTGIMFSATFSSSQHRPRARLSLALKSV